MAVVQEIMSRLILLLLLLSFGIFIGNVNCYNRPPARSTISLSSSDQDLTSSSTQQVHISLVGKDKMRISWVTEEDETPAKVEYGTTKGTYNLSTTGTTSSYKYMVYKSGEIHDVVIGPLKPSTMYYYRCGSDTTREFSFKTPPSQFPIKFVVSGDLGQTGWTTSTLNHIGASNYDLMLLPGDLSYADFYQPRWDSFGRLVENLASQRPWMVTIGNHEVEKIPLIHPKSFTAYNARWHMPFEESGSGSNLFYSFEVTGVHVIMLGSYTDFEPGSDQYNWLQNDLTRVDRNRTSWVIVVIHAPWYNTNTAHQGENESVGMKKSMEELLYKARVDVVFSGHVHAYERFTRVYNDKADSCGPAHITIGDGGNREGLATKYIDPQPNISLFREASFGHGRFEVVNKTLALWSWHRNDDDESVVVDSVWLKSLSSDPTCH